MLGKIVHNTFVNCVSVIALSFAAPAMTDLERRQLEILTNNESMFLNIIGY